MGRLGKIWQNMNGNERNPFLLISVGPVLWGAWRAFSRKRGEWGGRIERERAGKPSTLRSLVTCFAMCNCCTALVAQLSAARNDPSWSLQRVRSRRPQVPLITCLLLPLPGVSLLPNLSRSKRFCPLSPSFPTSCLWGVGGWFISELIYRMLLMSSWWAVTRVNGRKRGKIQLTLQLAGQWLICIKSGGKRSAMYRQLSCLISAQSAGASEGEACEHIVWIADRPSGSRLVGRCRCWSYRPRRFSIKWGGVSTDPIWGGAGQECAGRISTTTISPKVQVIHIKFPCGQKAIMCQSLKFIA